MKNLFVALMSVITPWVISSSHAQSVPALINYQGQIQNPNGTVPPTADYELSFRIYDAAQGGTLIWGPQVFDGTSGPGKGPRIPVVQGYFNLMLGPTDTSARSLANAFDASSRFIEVTVSNRPPIAPRQQLLSGPYAIRSGFAQEAANAQSLEGRLVGDFVAKTGDTMTGTLSLPANSFNVGGSQLVASGGSVGIGTTAPQATFHIAHGSRNDAIMFGRTAVDSPRMAMGHGPDTSGSEISFISSSKAGNANYVPMSMWTGDQERLRIGVEGNVGIGIANPQHKLEVAGTVKATAFSGQLSPDYDSGWFTVTIGQTYRLDLPFQGLPSLVTAYYKLPTGEVFAWGLNQYGDANQGNGVLLDFDEMGNLYVRAPSGNSNNNAIFHIGVYRNRANSGNTTYFNINTTSFRVKLWR